MVCRKSKVFRLRDQDGITVEGFGSLHQGFLMLECSSITKTVIARTTEQLEHDATVDLSAPVSEYLPELT